ncbi:MAG: Flp family type IVb pilin [Acidimicrobiales bacterium]
MKEAAQFAHAWLVSTLKTRERGATAVEYGIMVAAIAAVIIAVVIAVGDEVDTAFTDVNTELAGLS